MDYELINYLTITKIKYVMSNGEADTIKSQTQPVLHQVLVYVEVVPGIRQNAIEMCWRKYAES